ncbi:MAG: DUF4440 domain-containing protein [Burkholderiales bacterium]
MRLLVPSDPLARGILAREQALLQPDVRKSQELADSLADEFIEFGTSGRMYTRQDLVEALKAESPSRLTTSHVRVFAVAEHVVLVAYMIERHGTPAVHTLRSSLWERKQGAWRMVFHQGTRTDDPHAAAG